MGNISIKLNKKSVVNEISFSKGNRNVFYNNINILEDPSIIKILDSTEKPYNTVGFKVYFETGIAITGFSKKKDDKTVSFFSKELIDLWKA